MLADALASKHTVTQLLAAIRPGSRGGARRPQTG